MTRMLGFVKPAESPYERQECNLITSILDIAGTALSARLIDIGLIRPVGSCHMYGFTII